jgi:hypothetical protein
MMSRSKIFAVLAVAVVVLAAGAADAKKKKGPKITHKVTFDFHLTLVHFAAQLQPCLTRENTLHTLNTPQHPFNTGCTTPTRTPYPLQSAQVELKSGRA